MSYTVALMHINPGWKILSAVGVAAVVGHYRTFLKPFSKTGKHMFESHFTSSAGTNEPATCLPQAREDRKNGGTS